jgi:hypothetical protein
MGGWNNFRSFRLLLGKISALPFQDPIRHHRRICSHHSVIADGYGTEDLRPGSDKNAIADLRCGHYSDAIANDHLMTNNYILPRFHSAADNNAQRVRKQRGYR